jgi:putative sterol carrier protein
MATIDSGTIAAGRPGDQQGGIVSDQAQLDPEQFAEIVKGLSDEELSESIKNLGVDEVLKNIFDGMQDAFQPNKAQGVNSTLQYDIVTDDGTKQWTVEIADGKCTTSEGAATDPRLTLELTLVDFVRLIFGQAQGQQLFMTGKLKLKGDMMFAMQMQTFFQQPGT